MKKGFTLIEIVVSLAILGVGLLGIIELFSGGLRTERIAVEYSKAMEYAQLKMEEIGLSPSFQEGKEEGRFDEHFRWEVFRKKVDLLPEEILSKMKPPVQLMEVKVKVFWRSGLKERALSIDSHFITKNEEGS
ncbi:MAG: type IV pilus modification PilV family protein [Thermodesulfobacteriota bacterium]